MYIGPVIAVTDLRRARDFYEDQLGLEGEPTPGGWIVRGLGGTVCYLLPDIGDAGTASWPVASFEVDDVRSTVRELRSRGSSSSGRMTCRSPWMPTGSPESSRDCASRGFGIRTAPCSRSSRSTTEGE